MAASVSSLFPKLDGFSVRYGAPLSDYTRFGIGGPAGMIAETSDESAFVAALLLLRERDIPHAVIGSGTNLIVSDEGFRGVILRYTAAAIRREGALVECDAGAQLIDLVRFSVDHGLEGAQTLMGIPGSVGAAIYGNAGAYGHSISELVRELRYFDGARIATLAPEACEFQYRESIFKRNRDWRILRVLLEFREADSSRLRQAAEEILTVRNQKFPPSMKCAGSIFKNLMAADLPCNVVSAVPERVIREGKIPAAWFLEQVGAKGSREGGIRIAPYHANLIYNETEGTARELCSIIDRLKRSVYDRFGILLEEEVQYLGFTDR